MRCSLCLSVMVLMVFGPFVVVGMVSVLPLWVTLSVISRVNTVSLRSLRLVRWLCVDSMKWLAYLASFLLVVSCALPASAVEFTGATLAPVLDDSLEWRVVSRSDGEMTIETTIIAGRIYHGTYVDGLDLAKTDVGYAGELETIIGSNSINAVQLGFPVTGSTYQTGLLYDSRFDLRIFNEALFEIVSGIGLAKISYDVPSSIHWAYANISPSAVDTNFAATSDYSINAYSSSSISVPSVSSDGLTALFVRYDLTNIPLQDYGSDTALQITGNWRIQLSGPESDLTPYLDGSLSGIFDGFESSFGRPDLDFDASFDSDGVSFISSVLGLVRTHSFLFTGLALACSWALVAYLVWHRS